MAKRRKKLRKSEEKEIEYRDIFIEHRPFKTLITSAIEVYNRETSGVLLGKNTAKEIKYERKKVLAVKEVYPFQTEKRKPSEVIHGNVEAFKRVLRTINSFEAEIVGGYHSHPHPYIPIRLSSADVDSIKDDIEAMVKVGHERVASGWLEILLSIKRKEYAKPSGREWYICDYIKKVRCYVRTHEKTGYDILISAYWVYPKNNKKNESGKLKDWEMKVKEVGVYVPWNLD